MHFSGSWDCVSMIISGACHSILNCCYQLAKAKNEIYVISRSLIKQETLLISHSSFASSGVYTSCWQSCQYDGHFLPKSFSQPRFLLIKDSHLCGPAMDLKFLVRVLSRKDTHKGFQGLGDLVQPTDTSQVVWHDFIGQVIGQFGIFKVISIGAPKALTCMFRAAWANIPRTYSTSWWFFKVVSNSNILQVISISNSAGTTTQKAEGI